MLDDIVFLADFGDKKRQVVISKVSAAAGTTFHLYIDNYFICGFSKTKDSGWQWNTPNEEMQSADIDILIDMIEEHWGIK